MNAVSFRPSSCNGTARSSGVVREDRQAVVFQLAEFGDEPFDLGVGGGIRPLGLLGVEEPAEVGEEVVGLAPGLDVLHLVLDLPRHLLDLVAVLQVGGLFFHLVEESHGHSFAVGRALLRQAVRRWTASAIWSRDVVLEMRRWASGSWSPTSQPGTAATPA